MLKREVNRERKVVSWGQCLRAPFCLLVLLDKADCSSCREPGVIPSSGCNLLKPASGETAVPWALVREGVGGCFCKLPVGLPGTLHPPSLLGPGRPGSLSEPYLLLLCDVREVIPPL